MTKKLEDILNLPNVKKAFEEVYKKEKDKKSKENSNGAVSSKNLDPQTKKNLEKTKNNENKDNKEKLLKGRKRKENRRK